MELPQVLHNAGALIVFATGALAFVRPDVMARVMALSFESRFGESELRAGTGGVLVGAAGLALWTQDALAFAAIGAAFLGATLARWVDIARGNTEARVWAGVFLDAALAILLLYPQAG